MRKAVFAAVGSLAVVFGSGVVLANEGNATQAIEQGDYARAERTLVAELRIFPQRPELMLNLAAVYRRTGRTAEAQAMYVEVLRRPDILLDVTTGETMSAHAVAQAALANTEIAAR